MTPNTPPSKRRLKPHPQRNAYEDLFPCRFMSGCGWDNSDYLFESNSFSRDSGFSHSLDIEMTEGCVGLSKPSQYFLLLFEMTGGVSLSCLACVSGYSDDGIFNGANETGAGWRKQILLMSGDCETYAFFSRLVALWLPGRWFGVPQGELWWLIDK